VLHHVVYASLAHAWAIWRNLSEVFFSAAVVSRLVSSLLALLIYIDAAEVLAQAVLRLYFFVVGRAYGRRHGMVLLTVEWTLLVADALGGYRPRSLQSLVVKFLQVQLIYLLYLIWGIYWLLPRKAWVVTWELSVAVDGLRHGWHDLPYGPLSHHFVLSFVHQIARVVQVRCVLGVEGGGVGLRARLNAPHHS